MHVQIIERKQKLIILPNYISLRVTVLDANAENSTNNRPTVLYSTGVCQRIHLNYHVPLKIHEYYAYPDDELLSDKFGRSVAADHNTLRIFRVAYRAYSLIRLIISNVHYNHDLSVSPCIPSFPLSVKPRISHFFIHMTDIPPPLFSSRIRGVEILELLADNYRQLVVRTLLLVLHESGRHVAGSAKSFSNVYSSRHDHAVG